MKILHLANGFPTNRLYSHLLNDLEIIGYENTVYAFIQKSQNITTPLEHCSYKKKIFPILGASDRFLFNRKIKRCFQKTINEINLKTYQDCVIHAHNLYSDGVLASRLATHLNVPFVVTIRNQDLNTFFKFRPDLYKVARSVLIRAHRIITLNPNYLERVGRLFRLSDTFLKERGKVVPNGISDEWFGDTPNRGNCSQDALNVLFVGDNSKNKNISGLIAALNEINDYTINLGIVGGGGRNRNRFELELEKLEHSYTDFGYIDDVQKLKKIMSSYDILAVPSFHESFGLVYIEALSQGLLCVHSINEGIDGLMSDGFVTKNCDPRSPKSISLAIKHLNLFKDKRKMDAKELAQNFTWKNVASQLGEIYDDAARN